MQSSIWASLFAVLPIAGIQDLRKTPPGKLTPTSIEQSTPSIFDHWERTAVVTATIRPHQPGQIFFQGSWWRAICGQNVELKTGMRVSVVDQKNITYIVEPFA